MTLKEAGDISHEFLKGEVFAMVGASIAHNTIALRQGPRGQQRRVQMEAVRLAVQEGRH